MAWIKDGLAVEMVSDNVTINGEWIVIPGKCGERERLIPVKHMQWLINREFDVCSVYQEVTPGVPAP
jgi:hypothetical protein